MHGAYDNLAYGDMDTFEMSCQEGLSFVDWRLYVAA